jgi:hypothetical protein
MTEPIECVGHVRRINPFEPGADLGFLRCCSHVVHSSSHVIGRAAETWSRRLGSFTSP